MISWGMMFIPLEQSKGKEFACRYRPIIYQRFEDVRDLITPIHLGRHIPNLKPVAYYSCKTDGTWLAINYHFFHRHDWSKGKFGGILRDKLDTHEFDFEGCCILIRLPIKDEWSRPRHLITQFHSELIHVHLPEGDEGRVYLDIEAQGHGIEPEYDDDPRKGNIISYYDYKLVNMDSPRFLEWWPKLEKTFNKYGVDMPTQVNHWPIRRHEGKSTDGLIYTDPVKLLKSMGV